MHHPHSLRHLALASTCCSLGASGIPTGAEIVILDPISRGPSLVCAPLSLLPAFEVEIVGHMASYAGFAV